MLNAATRPEALLLALPFYQGAPCKRGHSGTRYTSTKACCDCAAEQGQGRRRSGKRTAEQRRNWTSANIDKVKALRRARAALAKVARAPIIAARKAEQEAKRAAAAVLKEARRQEREAVSLVAPLRLIARNRAKAKRRNAAKRGAHCERVTAKQLTALLVLQRGGCAYCGNAEIMHLDHIVPLIKGGIHAMSNLQWLCAFHNLSKKDRDDCEYRRLIGVPDQTQWDSIANGLLFAAAMAPVTV